MAEIKIRIATVQDAESLVKIYAPYVEKTAVSFEDTVPTAAEFKERMSLVLKKYPFLVAETNGEPLGYAYAGAFNERAAYIIGGRKQRSTCGKTKSDRGLGALYMRH